jgi:hypothetical protein
MPGRSVADHLKEVPQAVRPTLQAARRAIKAVAPGALEVAYQGTAPRSSTFMWKIARYEVNGANVVGIGTYPLHSNLFFYRGRELDDGRGLLAGTGKEMRSITLRAPADLARPEIKTMLKKAFQLGGAPPTTR